MPSNGIQVALTGEVTPTSLTDTYPVLNPYYGLGGLRNVVDLSDRDAITTARRESGMLAFVQSTLRYYKMEDGLTNVDWADLGTKLGGTAPIIPITYSSLATLLSGNLAIPGTLYKITDKASLGITTQAIAPNKLNTDCSGSFLNCDFQNILGNNLGVWYTGLTGIVVGVSIVICYGRQFRSLTGSVGTAPLSDTTNWQQVPFNTSYYINEVDKITYDFDQDRISSRNDKRFNLINGYPEEFQFGNDNVSYNTISGVATAFIWGNLGQFTYNTLSGASYISVNGIGAINNCSFVNTTLNNSNLNANILNSSFVNSALNINTNGFVVIDKSQFVNANIAISPTFTLSLVNCIINKNSLITIERNSLFANKQIDNNASNFDIILNATPIFAAGVLTLPTVLNYIGVFTFTGLAGQTISKVANLPSGFTVKCYTDTPNTVSYTVSPVATAAASAIIGSVVGTTAIVGRANGADYIELVRVGTRNQRVNVIKNV